eukprot:59401-Rhodomonas_salina.2
MHSLADLWLTSSEAWQCGMPVHLALTWRGMRRAGSVIAWDPGDRRGDGEVAAGLDHHRPTSSRSRET